MALSKPTFSSPSKKKRNLPGMPDPDAEVVALSPKTLLATNRFVCEICGKGFQREQNLQLHRRRHNVPWKLRQGTRKELGGKKVYVCPEPSCVHNNPSRALGDITGIKKHFCRKHGEKKLSCQRCSKKYAVQSDWKAHIKTCGTKKYRCHCGTVISRRDDFITHRAFCDVLAKKDVKAKTLSISGSDISDDSNRNFPFTSSLPLQLSLTPSMSMMAPALSIESSGILENPVKNVATGTPSTSTSTRVFASIFASSATMASSQSSSLSNNLMFSVACSCSDRATTMPISTIDPTSLFLPTASPQPPSLSATALLQKATQMGATPSNASLLRALGLTTSSSRQHGHSIISTTLQWNNSNIKNAKQEKSQSSAYEGQPFTRDLLGLSIGGISPLFTSSFGEKFDASTGGERSSLQ